MAARRDGWSRFAFVVAIPCVATAAPRAGKAQESTQIHGFVSQGFIKSTDNNYLGQSERGSFEFTEVGINFTYLSKIENDKVDFAAFPSEETIRKLAKVLDADVDELLLMAEKIPDHIRRRVLEKPEEFRMIASLDDKSLERLVKGMKLN